MFAWIRNKLARSNEAGPRRAPVARVRAVRSGLRALLASYDAAATNDENRRHWANADGLSADAAASPEVRRLLRNRARYEVANNSYAKGIVLTLANDAIGTGPRLQMLTEAAEVNQRIEREFGRWAKTVGLAEKLRTLRTARATDGEAFLLLGSNPKLPGAVKLDLRLIEADQVTTPDLSILDPNAIDGIVLDEYGNPVQYHVLKVHPGDTRAGAGSGLSYDRVPAEAVIHYFRVDRPGQSRGIPDLTPALPLFAQLRRYTLAVLGAAETAADFAGILYTDAPPDGQTESVEPMDAIELEARSLLTMPGGWKMSQVQAEQPSTTYGEFKKELLNEIARCLNMPFNVAAANSSAYNYASGRMDHQTYFKSIRVDQEHVEDVVLDRILTAWIGEAVLVEGLLPQPARTRDAEFPHQWFWDGQEHVDPAKEATAQATRLGSHTTTLASEYARVGRDWESELRQRAKEVALMAELGLTPQQLQPIGKEAGDDEDE
ncbi:MAG: phage portal protein [Planctomycetes bacterium]|nr:phage portal protein [Planctomycetota bacterium]